MQRSRGIVEQGQVRQVQIIIYGRVEAKDEAWKKEVGRPEIKDTGGVRKTRVMIPELRRVREKKSGWPRTYWDESILDSTAPVLSWVDPLSTPGVLSQVPYQSLPPTPGDTYTHPPSHPWTVLQ